MRARRHEIRPPTIHHIYNVLTAQLRPQIPKHRRPGREIIWLFEILVREARRDKVNRQLLIAAERVEMILFHEAGSVDGPVIGGLKQGVFGVLVHGFEDVDGAVDAAGEEEGGPQGRPGEGGDVVADLGCLPLFPAGITHVPMYRRKIRSVEDGLGACQALISVGSDREQSLPYADNGFMLGELGSNSKVEHVQSQRTYWSL